MQLTVNVNVFFGIQRDSKYYQVTKSKARSICLLQQYSLALSRINNEENRVVLFSLIFLNFLLSSLFYSHWFFLISFYRLCWFLIWRKGIETYKFLDTVKPLITNTSKEFIKCRILHFLINGMLQISSFLIKWLYGTL